RPAAAPSAGLRGREGARAAGRRGAADRRAAGAREARGGGLPRRRTGRARGDRARSLRRAARRAPRRPRAPPACAGQVAGGEATRGSPMSEPPPPRDPAVAYAHCESVTRRRAANFYWGIRLLPRDRRRAMCAVYAFARRVDDIGDGALDAAEKLARLDRQERTLAGVARASACRACRPR